MVSQAGTSNGITLKDGVTLSEKKRFCCAMSNYHDPMKCIYKTTTDPFRWLPLVTKYKKSLCYVNWEYIFSMFKKILRIHKITKLANFPNLIMMLKKIPKKSLEFDVHLMN